MDKKQRPEDHKFNKQRAKQHIKNNKLSTPEKNKEEEFKILF